LPQKKDSLNSIGNIQVFYPILHYLSQDKSYLSLYLNKWILNGNFSSLSNPSGKSKQNVNKRQIEVNIVSMILNLIHNLYLNGSSLNERFKHNWDIPILSHLLNTLPAHFIDVNLLRVCQLIVDDASLLDEKTLLYSIYKYLLFDFGIWNKAEYDIRFGLYIFVYRSC
jgi:hypothetical protein